MNRRQWLARSAIATPVAFSFLHPTGGRAAPPAAAKLAPLKITDVKTILTAPAGIRLVVVKVQTSEPGLYGLGCATFTQRARAVETAIDKYLKPFLIGKDPPQIEDIWQSCFVSSYWRNGPVLGNALSGVDMALWDILGKRAGMPVYQLLGGKCRKAVDTYRHASGQTFEDVEKAARELMDAGLAATSASRSPCRAWRPTAPAARAQGADGPDANARPQVWEPRAYVRTVPKLFEHLRKQLGDEVELLHDIHERVPPILAMQLAKDLGAVQAVLPRRPVQPGGRRLLREAAAADEHADRDGRAVQQPERVGRRWSATG